MFDWLRRLGRGETPEEADAALLRAARRRQSPAADRAARPFAPDPTLPFPSDLYPSDGSHGHHGAHAPCDGGHSFGCDAAGGSHH